MPEKNMMGAPFLAGCAPSADAPHIITNPPPGGKLAIRMG
jgi:hypothetical protein